MNTINKNPNLIYLCGAISKNPNSFSEFALAEEKINAMGYETVNPHEICRHILPSNFETPEEHWEACMRNCLSHIAFCKTIVTLPGWIDSNGAVKEVSVARALGFIDVIYFETFIAKSTKA